VRCGFCSLPIPTQVLGIVHRTISAHILKKARLTRASGATGAVTLIQRFGSALNLNIHFHMLVLDGAYLVDTERFAAAVAVLIRQTSMRSHSVVRAAGGAAHGEVGRAPSAACNGADAVATNSCPNAPSCPDAGWQKIHLAGGGSLPTEDSVSGRERSGAFCFTVEALPMALTEYRGWDRTQRVFHWVNFLAVLSLGGGHAPFYLGHSPLARILLCCSCCF
jgi:hypothetical protein